MVSSKRTASVTSRSSPIRSTTLVEFHNVARRARHPLLEASCLFTSGQYHLWDLASSRFLGVMPPNPVSWTEDGLKQLGFGVPSIEAMSVSSTSASLTGVDTIPSASRSSWLSSDPWIMLSYGSNQQRGASLAFPSCFFDFFYWALLHLG